MGGFLHSRTNKLVERRPWVYDKGPLHIPHPLHQKKKKKKVLDSCQKKKKKAKLKWFRSYHGFMGMQQINSNEAQLTFQLPYDLTFKMQMQKRQDPYHFLHFLYKCYIKRPAIQGHLTEFLAIVFMMIWKKNFPLVTPNFWLLK
jgi:hypothetical protein